MTRQVNGEGWLTRERVLAALLIVITALVLYLCYRLTLPFVPALTWGVALAVIAYPLHEWLRRRLKQRALVAALTVLIVSVVLVLPAAFVVREIASQAMENAEKVNGEVASGRWLKTVERNPKLAPLLKWLNREVGVREQSKLLSEELVEKAKAFISGSLYVITGWLVTISCSIISFVTARNF